MADTTFAWLIERGQSLNHAPTVWWKGGDVRTGVYDDEWTEDANMARRFPTRDAAEAVASRLFAAPLGVWSDHCSVVEHGWLPPGANDAATPVADRCPDCDAPLATEADFAAHPPAYPGYPPFSFHPAATETECISPGCSLICWRRRRDGTDRVSGCTRPPVDWRARALAAESAVAKAHAALCRGDHGDAGTNAACLASVAITRSMDAAEAEREHAEEVAALREQAAASQAREVKLREALTAHGCYRPWLGGGGIVEVPQGDPDCIQRGLPREGKVRERMCRICAALALPADRSALDAMTAEARVEEARLWGDAVLAGAYGDDEIKISLTPETLATQRANALVDLQATVRHRIAEARRAEAARLVAVARGEAARADSAKGEAAPFAAAMAWRMVRAIEAAAKEPARLTPPPTTR